MRFSGWELAAFWGLVSGSALVIGAGIAYFFSVPARWVAGIMAFGSGVLISALSFELMDASYKKGGFSATAIGFISGAVIYTVVSLILANKGARHRKRSGVLQPTEKSDEGSGTAIALGALLDGIPESIVIGLSLLAGGGVGKVAVIAIFLSNLPEGLSSAAGMKNAGRSAKYIFGVWGAIMILSALASMSGYLIFKDYSVEVIAATSAVAAGAILAMISDTMIPEAFAETHALSGLITVVGFLCAFGLSKLSH
ncbi:MAG: ZIP family zinc transporter [Cryobacterium sp.]|nr:ZIP family zinc transporter [Oligoflexia bacterium]